MFIKSENKNKITNKPYLLCVNETRKCTIDNKCARKRERCGNNNLESLEYSECDGRHVPVGNRASVRCACVACMPELLNCKSIAMRWLTVLIIIRGSCMATLQRTMRLLGTISKAYKWLNPNESLRSEGSSSEKNLFFVKFNINYRKQYVSVDFFRSSMYLYEFMIKYIL